MARPGVRTHGRTVIGVAGTAHVTGKQGHRKRLWDARQRSYWAWVSPAYEALYLSRWSVLENAWVKERLRSLVGESSAVVVDLAAGTGLGHRLVAELNTSACYVGLDISREMLAVADPPFPAVITAMDEIGCLRSCVADVIISLFTSGSFASDPSALLAEVHRLLKPGGVAYLSVLSSRALSRITSRNRGAARYHTRGASIGLGDGRGAPVHRFTVRQLRRLATESRLRLLDVRGMNVLSGVAEWRGLWTAGRLVAIAVPGLSHSLELVVRRDPSPDRS